MSDSLPWVNYETSFRSVRSLSHHRAQLCVVCGYARQEQERCSLRLPTQGPPALPRPKPPCSKPFPTRMPELRAPDRMLSN